RLGTTRWWRGNNPSNLAWSADGKLLASGGDEVVLHDTDTAKALRRLNRAGPCALSPDGRRVAASCESQEVCVWDVSTGKEVLRFPIPLREVRPSDRLSGGTVIGRQGFVAYSPDGKLLALGGERASIVDAATGKEVAALAGQERPVTAGAFSPDGKRLVTDGNDQLVIVRDASTGKVVR